MAVHRLGRRGFLRSVGAAAGLPRLAGRSRQPGRPNLLLIFADDLGYGDVSLFGRPDYRTPGIDRIGLEGIRFSDAYAAASTCTPTRAGLLTGRYPARFPPGLQSPMGWVNDRDGLSPEHPTISSRLRAAGYRTALVGKWHLGHLPEFGPLRHGFDEFFGIKSGGVDYFTHDGPNGEADLWDGSVPVERAGYLTDLLTDRAIEVIDRRDPRPFYLSLHYTAPHWPWEGPEDGHGPGPSHPFVDGGSAVAFRAMMRSLDRGVGRVMEALGRGGKDRDTLVVFTSDNGGERYSYNWPFSDQKWTLYEGGIRVPAMLRWKGRVPPGRSSSQLVTTMDWTATFLAAAGVAPDPAHPLDGIDLLGVATGAARPVSRTLFWRQHYAGRPRQGAARRDRWKYLRIDDQERLFDLAVDPGEKGDLAKVRPELLAELREAFERWSAELPPLPAPQPPPPR
jgi:arylsulfatase A-like enzyme